MLSYRRLETTKDSWGPLSYPHPTHGWDGQSWGATGLPWEQSMQPQRAQCYPWAEQDQAQLQAWHSTRPLLLAPMRERTRVSRPHFHTEHQIISFKLDSELIGLHSINQREKAALGGSFKQSCQILFRGFCLRSELRALGGAAVTPTAPRGSRSGAAGHRHKLGGLSLSRPQPQKQAIQPPPCRAGLPIQSSASQLRPDPPLPLSGPSHLLTQDAAPLNRTAARQPYTASCTSSSGRRGACWVL